MQKSCIKFINTTFKQKKKITQVFIQMEYLRMYSIYFKFIKIISSRNKSLISYLLSLTNNKWKYFAMVSPKIHFVWSSKCNKISFTFTYLKVSEKYTIV